MTQQPIQLTILSERYEVLKETDNFDGYVPRKDEKLVFDCCGWRVIDCEWGWNDSLTQMDCVCLIVRKL